MCRVAFASLLAVLISLSPPLWALAAQENEKKIVEKNTLYQHLSVIEDTKRNERYLRSKKGEVNHGGISLSQPERLLLLYTKSAFIGLAFLDRDPKDALFIGLGIGSMPRYFNRYYPEANIDIVEIDPDVPHLAKKYFFFRETPQMRLTIEDGRIFVKRSKRTYDMIFLDAYQNDSIPFHLATLEFFREVKAKLRPGGVVVANILVRSRSRFFDAIVKTYRKAFSQVYVFKWKYDENYIFIATEGAGHKDQGAVAAHANELDARKRFDVSLPGIATFYEPIAAFDNKSDAKVLTDDFAPVNIYQHQETGGRR